MAKRKAGPKGAPKKAKKAKKADTPVGFTEEDWEDGLFGELTNAELDEMILQAQADDAAAPVDKNDNAPDPAPADKIENAAEVADQVHYPNVGNPK
jgi:hypothetical protein